MVRKNKAPSPLSSPTPEQVRSVRMEAGLTQAAAAEIVHAAPAAWQNWEANEALSYSRVMPASAWELFLLHCHRARVALPAKLAEYIEAKWE